MFVHLKTEEDREDGREEYVAMFFPDGKRSISCWHRGACEWRLEWFAGEPIPFTEKHVRSDRMAVARLLCAGAVLLASE